MKNIDDLIELIMGDPKLRESKTLGEKVYRDEPILKRASQLVRDIVPPKDDTPAQLMEMRRMVYSPEAQWRSREWLFGKQGKFMEDFEDSFDKNVPFEHYFPTYNDMTLEQQRTYFTWRTRIRKGEFCETSLSYIFVYIYLLTFPAVCKKVFYLTSAIPGHLLHQCIALGMDGAVVQRLCSSLHT